MKKEKNLYLIIIGILVVVIVLLFVAIFMIENEKKSSNTITKIICEKTTKEENYEQIDKYTIHKDISGEVKKYETESTTTYKDKDSYIVNKEALKDNKSVKFDDKKQMQTLIDTVDMTKNNKKEEIHVWYKNLQMDLESQGYSCK